MTFRAVILAAGQSTRMGRQKLLMPFRGRAMIEHAIAAASAWHPLVVASPEVADAVRALPGVELVFNEQPQRGMTHSLALADARIEPDAALIVMLGDKPLVTSRLIAQLCETLGAGDVAFPRDPRSGEPGHPVIFSPRARRGIANLPSGDSLRLLRDDPRLVTHVLQTSERGAYVDIDTIADVENA